MKFSIQEGSFYLNDKKVFLNSGEIHYFRIKRDLWNKHLDAAKEAGLMTVSTYVPWAWHEFEESVFDFDGASVRNAISKGGFSYARPRIELYLKTGTILSWQSFGEPDCQTGLWTGIVTKSRCVTVKVKYSRVTESALFTGHIWKGKFVV